LLYLPHSSCLPARLEPARS